MSSQIQLYLANNSLLDEKQSGFRKKRSCITAITNIVEDIRQELDSNCVTFLTLLDHSEAFDFVNHNILCTKLRNMFNFSTTYGRVQVTCSFQCGHDRVEETYHSRKGTKFESFKIPPCSIIARGGVLQ